MEMVFELKCSRRLVWCGLGKVVGTNDIVELPTCAKGSVTIRRLKMVMLRPPVVTPITTSQSGERRVTRVMPDPIVKGIGRRYSAP